MAAIAAGVVVTASAVLYVRYVVNTIARSHLTLADGVLTVRGQTGNGFAEHRYPVGDIASVAFGVPLNTAERLMEGLNQIGVGRSGMTSVVKDLKAGRLVVTNRAGASEEYHFINKAFDPDSLQALATELARAGVTVASG